MFPVFIVAIEKRAQTDKLESLVKERGVVQGIIINSGAARATFASYRQLSSMEGLIGTTRHFIYISDEPTTTLLFSCCSVL